MQKKNGYLFATEYRIKIRIGLSRIIPIPYYEVYAMNIIQFGMVDGRNRAMDNYDTLLGCHINCDDWILEQIVVALNYVTSQIGPSIGRDALQ